MGVDPNLGRFPICPLTSCSVPVCPDWSLFRASNRPKEEKQWDITGYSGQIRKRPHLGSTPILLTFVTDCCKMLTTKFVAPALGVTLYDAVPKRQEKTKIRFLPPRDYRHIRNYYLSNSKTFQDGNGNGNFRKIDSNDFQDGNWESMVMKG